MYQKYQVLVKQFILKATNRALYQLCQASAAKHLEITWATEQSNLYKYTFISATITTTASKVMNHH